MRKKLERGGETLYGKRGKGKGGGFQKGLKRSYQEKDIL